MHFGLTDNIIIALPERAGIDVFCSLVPLPAHSSTEVMVPFSASVIFGKSANNKAADGFSKTNVWHQFKSNDNDTDEIKRSDTIAKAAWEGKLRLNHSSDRSVRLSFTPFADACSGIAPPNAEQQHLEIVWNKDTSALNDILEGDLIKNAYSAYLASSKGTYSHTPKKRVKVPKTRVRRD